VEGTIFFRERVLVGDRQNKAVFDLDMPAFEDELGGCAWHQLDRQVDVVRIVELSGITILGNAADIDRFVVFELIEGDKSLVL